MCRAVLFISFAWLCLGSDCCCCKVRYVVYLSFVPLAPNPCYRVIFHGSCEIARANLVQQSDVLSVGLDLFLGYRRVLTSSSWAGKGALRPRDPYGMAGVTCDHGLQLVCAVILPCMQRIQ